MKEMASWKEKGFVPDSDDEESLASDIDGSEGKHELETRSTEQGGNSEKENVHTPLEYQEAEDGLDEAAPSKETSVIEDAAQRDGTLRGHGTADDEGIILTCPEDAAVGNHTTVEGGDFPPSIIRPSSPDVLSRHLFPSLSPRCPPAFKVPFDIWDSDHDQMDTKSQVGKTGQDVPNSPHSPVPDDVSTSYVRLTSPVSSMLSSPRCTMQDSTLNQQGSLSWNRDDRSEPLEHAPTATDLLNMGPEFDIQAGITPPTRELRRRAPIQLHPYAMEQEKYRQSLKARGLKPMRLAQTQEDGDGIEEVSSPPAESQDAEALVFDEDLEENQAMDFNWDLHSSQPPGSIEDEAPVNSGKARSASSDDEDFPDIDELLRMPKLSAGSKRKLKDYSTKSDRPRLSKRPALGEKSTSSRRTGMSVFDGPGSPPVTSSPFPTARRSMGSQVPRAISVSSKEPTPSWLDHDELASSTATVSTPPTSALRPAFEPIPLEFEVDEDDPFASEPNDATSSSSDESVHVQKIGKRFRGVLPASHLRLDQQIKKQKQQVQTRRDLFSTSPQKVDARRGIAQPKAPGTIRVTSSSTNLGINLFSDESDGEDEDEARPLEIGVQDENEDLSMFFLASRRGFAEEEDRIDAMLPARQRQCKNGFNAKPRKRMKTSSGSLATNGSRQTYQPRITEHLAQRSSFNDQRNSRPKKGKSRRNHVGILGRPISPPPPRLSILDVNDFRKRLSSRAPHFIRVAARTARTRVDQGRQAPSRKFIRLATREDTADAQSVLEDWKNGDIIPKNLEPHMPFSVSIQAPLQSVANNRQTRLPPPQAKGAPRQPSSTSSSLETRRIRQLSLSKGRQASMNNFASVDPRPVLWPYPKFAPIANSAGYMTHRHPTNPRYQALHARRAQLESSEVDYSHRNPVAAFIKTKKALDTVFRGSRKLTVQEKNLQLNRFLANDDIIQLSVEVPSLPQVDSATTIRDPVKLPSAMQIKQRKRSPQHIDAGTLQYRQPSEALIIDLVAPSQVAEIGSESKLLGLGKYGTRYPTHFDILPLHRDVYFHESTFIASGRFSKALEVGAVISCSEPRGYTSFRLGDIEFNWGPWTETVSSQVGLLFDFLLEEIEGSGTEIADTDSVGLMTSLVDYVQHHLSFEASEGCLEFLSRMIEIMQDFLARLAAKEPSGDRQGARPVIDLMARCTVLAMQLLVISRAEQLNITFQLEDLLKSVAGICVKLCLQHGLDGLRKLYEDLQYMSLRDRGIRSEMYATHAWVLMLKVLEAAQIPRGSFWDVVNASLLYFDMNTVVDARLMEKMWYSMFSLLPLSEFNESGIVISGLCHKTSFDHWSLPQRLLKRVFALYSLNTRQSPSFNDYCRALFSRCHYLMCEWGWWKCSAMVGTLFDFFALHELSHLRNEEVYKSPRFLDALHTEPSLDVEPEDRCFHIFLKIVALCIKHFRKVGDLKSVRNLVARLLPNHNRQHPKDMEIHQKQLAALRNHHDLLCTLYWSSPRDLRPPLNLIQELVNPDQSHKEACLINIRAWANLARFIFRSTENEFAAQQQLTLWQDAFFDKLLQQYRDTNADVRKQAELLQAVDNIPITEAQLNKTIKDDRRSTMATLQTMFHDWQNNLQDSAAAGNIMVAMNFELFSKILNPKLFGVYQHLDDLLIGHSLDMVMVFVEHINNSYPAEIPELDSQDSLDLATVQMLDRQNMCEALLEHIFPNLFTIAREILESRLYASAEPSFMEKLVCCISTVVCLATETDLTLGEFVLCGPRAVFENRQRHPRAEKYWPKFLGELLGRKGLDYFQIPGFDIGTEWLQSVTKPELLLGYESSLTYQLIHDGHYLVHPGDRARGTDFEMWPQRHQHLIEGALKTIQQIKRASTTLGGVNTLQLAGRDIQPLFSLALKQTMDSMQHHLESMIPQTPTHKRYVCFCQHVTSFMRSYTSDIRPLSEFFTCSSIHYWPNVDDPHLFGPGILKYSSRLHDTSGNKAHSELFYYLYNGWKNDQMHSRLQSHITRVGKAMKDWKFTEFLLINYVPATISAGFNTISGSILPKTYLPTLAKWIPRYLEEGEGKGDATFAHTINLLKMIVNGIYVRAVNANEDALDDWDRPQRDTNPGVSVDHRGMLSIVCEFYNAMFYPMFAYATTYPENLAAFHEVTNLLNRFYSQCIIPLDQEHRAVWVHKHLDVKMGDHADRFVTLLLEDIRRDWEHALVRDAVVIRSISGQARVQVSMVQGVRTLVAVVRDGIHTFAGDGTEEKVRLRPPNYMGDGRTFPGVLSPIL